eukprot:COSAG04_NODE_30098_length_264_cov_1.569697_1_plen_23_part_10
MSTPSALALCIALSFSLCPLRLG